MLQQRLELGGLVEDTGGDPTYSASKPISEACPQNDNVPWSS